MFNVAELIVK